MSLLFSVIYATHANGTHHKLALDALNIMEAPRAEAWRRMFLKHAELYMQGSKAPDKEFKDFRNHVLHPGDEYWGGAPEKARAWYSNLVTALKEENWSEAVWCAGVLSHYYTDPIHPFHTAQSDAENAIHRAVEWSINKSYNDLFALGSQRSPNFEIELPAGETWIEDFVCAGADTSHKQYERLIAHYDINVGVSDPPAGLDKVARDLVGELLVYASCGFAGILDRAILEADVAPPQVNLSVDTVLAGLKIPLKWVLRKMDDANERAAVQAMYDELMGTGRVEETLPEDDRTVRELHAKEVVVPRRAKRDKERRRRVSKKKLGTPRRALSSLKVRETGNVEGPRIAAVKDKSSGVTRIESGLDEVASVASPVADASVPVVDNSVPDVDATAARASSTAPLAGAAATASATAMAMASSAVPFSTSSTEPVPFTGKSESSRTPRIYLSGSDPLEKAPAIGPKTAERLESAGLHTVADLLSADPEEIAEQTSHRYITAATVSDWQDFARLVMSVPGLRGTHAQLLAGAGYRTSLAIAEAEPAELSADILRFAATSDGNRILRDGAAPDIEKIKSWVESAAQAQAA